MERGLFNIILPSSGTPALSETTLVDKGLDRTTISYVSMTNTSAANVTVELFIEEGTNESHIVKTVIPPSVTLRVTEGLSFQNATFKLVLRIPASGGDLAVGTPLSVIVK